MAMYITMMVVHDGKSIVPGPWWVKFDTVYTRGRHPIIAFRQIISYIRVAFSKYNKHFLILRFQGMYETVVSIS